MPTASLADVQRLAGTLYATLREDLFGPGHPSTPSTLIVSGLGDAMAGADAGYVPSLNVICIPVPDGNLEDHDVLAVDAWPGWKVDLVEELAHEYQHKAQPAVTDTARILSRKYGVRFSGSGHDETFFSAAEVLAERRRLDTNALVKILVNGGL